MGHPFLPDRPVDQRQDRASIEAGGIPLRAQRRIAELHASQSPIFTSTLSPAETIVCRQNGMEALSQVMGTSMYHVGWSGYSTYDCGELGVITAAYERARELALSRMQQEAMLLRAHAVVGVVVKESGHAWSGDTMEFTAVGTAVRIAGMAPVQFPALSLMNADELYKLHSAGYWPTGIAMGNCFWYDPHADCFGEGNWASSELTSHSYASHSARRLAVERFRAFAQRLGGDGVVGVRVRRAGRDSEYEVNDSKHTSFTLEVMLLGTSVVRRGEARPPPRPLRVLDLRGRPMKSEDTAELRVRGENE
ncbi:MAG: heavy metal-binding domain-containing protein [Byssovorax sp.]